MLSFDTYASELPRGVHFSDPPSNNFHRAHSIATDRVPLLPAVSSASTVPKTAFRITNPTPGIDITAYIENCRNLNEQLRSAHEAERRAWNIERSALKARIVDLESKVNKTKDPKRRSSIESQTTSGHHTFRADVRAMYQSNKMGNSRPATDSVVPKVAPVWQGPETTPPITRVFHTEETNGAHLPAISEDEPLPSLSRQVSPSAVVDSTPVPIEQVDSTLDGITLKSAALTSSFNAKITSPQFGSPIRTPSPKTDDTKVNGGTLHINAATLLSPLDEKLKRHAGHTPMNFGNASAGTSEQPTEIPTPTAEKPPAPAPTKRPPLRPSERSDSYFSTVSDEDIKETIKETFEKEQGQAVEDQDDLEPQFEPENDRPLKGPLMLDSSARTKAASTFLEKLDAKLEAVRESSPDRRESFVSNGDGADDALAVQASKQPVESEKRPEADDDMPKLRLKKSTNFGSAYGFNMPGRM